MVSARWSWAGLVGEPPATCACPRQTDWLAGSLFDNLRDTDTLVETQDQCDPEAVEVNLTFGVTLQEIDCGDTTEVEKNLCVGVANIVGLPETVSHC